MASPSKAKGNRAENKVVKLLVEAGIKAIRSWGSNGRSIGHHEEVDVLALDNCRIQVKARKELPAMIRDALTEHVDIAIFIQDRSDPVVAMRFSDFSDILKKYGWQKD